MGSPEDRSKNETTPAGAKGRAEAVLRGEASPINKREHSAIRQVDATQTRRSCVMRNIVISVALGASAIFASSAADAAPLTKGLAMLPDNSIENVRLVCDEFGRCYRTRGGRRVIYGNSYGYAPGYYGGGYGPGVGVGIGPVGVGVGFGPRW